MTARELGKVTRLDPRIIFPDEARDFTPWLASHLNLLEECVELTLSHPETEVMLGEFRADVRCVDDADRVVIIENQLTVTDHSHLGQMLLYLSYLQGGAAIWIAGEIRPEYERAMRWLNEHTPQNIDVYLVLLEAISVDHGNPGPLFTLIVGPDEFRKGSAEPVVLEFWKQLEAKHISAGSLPILLDDEHDDSFWGFESGNGAMYLYYCVTQYSSRIELFIDYDDRDQNLQAYNRLLQSRKEIEAEIGNVLSWKDKAQRGACTVSWKLKQGGWADQDHWPVLIDTLVSTAQMYLKVLQPYLAGLPTYES